MREPIFRLLLFIEMKSVTRGKKKEDAGSEIHFGSWSMGIAGFGGADEAGTAGRGAAGWLWAGIGNPKGLWGLQSLACPSGWHRPPLELSLGLGWRHFSGNFLPVGALGNLSRFLENSSDSCCVYPWAPHAITEHPTGIVCDSGTPGMGSSVPCAEAALPNPNFLC